ncbi:MAG: arylesterase [Alphaproteobacteria bacterium]|nr:arylesterase [Alphaproteobacteria bacterium]
MLGSSKGHLAYRQRAGRVNRGLALAARALVVLLAVAVTIPWSGARAATTIVAFGDSLTAGYGLADPALFFPARLEGALRAAGVDVRLVNAGVSGDTSSGGLSRLDWSLVETPDLVILELGANDALRGIAPAITEANLDKMLAALAAKRIPVLLAGMLAPPNLGPEYGQAFNSLYTRLAAKYAVPLYPFFLDGVAAQSALLQNDGMHPNARGVDVIVERIVPYVLWALKAGPKPPGA